MISDNTTAVISCKGTVDLYNLQMQADAQIALMIYVIPMLIAVIVAAHIKRENSLEFWETTWVWFLCSMALVLIAHLVYILSTITTTAFGV